MQLTQEQEKKLKRIAKLVDFETKGAVVLIEDIFALEDEFGSKIPELKELVEELKKERPDRDEIKEIVREIVNGIEIPEAINGERGERGEDGKDYILTEKDKSEIAGKIKIPVVEKVIEKTEVKIEQPIEIIKEVAIISNDEITARGEAIRDGLELLQDDDRLDKKAIKGLENYEEVSKNAFEANTRVISNTRNFYQLLDAPEGGYVGQAGKVLKVKTDENGLEWGIGSTPEAQDLQDVTDIGATTTNSIEAQAFITTGGTSADYVKGDGSLGSVDLSGYVPYVGATGDVDLNDKNLNSVNTLEVKQTGTNALIIGDVSGNARGSSSFDIQSSRSLATQVASGFQCIAVGRQNTVDGGFNVAVGNTNTISDPSIAFSYIFGGSNTSTFSGSYGNYGGATIVGTSNNLSGSSGSGQTKNIAVGGSNIVSSSGPAGGNGTAIGTGNIVSGYKSVAIGINNYSINGGSTCIGVNTTVSGYGGGLAIGTDISSLANNNSKIGVNSRNININSIGLSVNNDNALSAIHSTGNLLVTDVGSLGAELVTNGNFTGNATGWTLGTGWAYSSNKVTKNVDGTGTLSQAISITAGKYYYITAQIYNITGTLNITLGGVNITDLLRGNGGNTSLTTIPTYRAVIKATTTGGLIFTPSNTGRVTTLDTVSVKEITGGDVLSLGNIVVENATNGMKIGTATSQKLGFFNATPIIQPIATTDLGTVLSNLGLRAVGTAYPITTSGATSFTGTIGLGGQITVADGINFAINTTTGTKIGTATGQKIGFWNKTPVIQQVTNAYTPAVESSAYTGIDNLQVGTPYAQVTDLNTLRVAYETLRASYDDLLTKLKNTGIVS